MLTTLLMAVFAANEVNPVEAEEPKWAIQLSLAAPSILHSSFALGGNSGSALGGLGGASLLGVSRPGFATALTVERAFGEHWTGAASLGIDTNVSSVFTTISGTGVLGARWYAKRSLDGFFVGPEVMFRLNTIHTELEGIAEYRFYAAGAGARAGWMQRFGDHFMASASAGVSANVAWTTTTLMPVQTLNVGLDLALGAGLLF